MTTTIPSTIPRERPRPARPSVLGRKQQTTHEAFVRVAERIEQYVSPLDFTRLLDQTIADVQAVRDAYGGIAYAWSGGKDSIALKAVMDAACGTGVDCVFGLTNLEWPAFLAWVTEHMPEGIAVFNTGQDLDWLARHPEMLFPRDANVAGQWFSRVQHTAQRLFVREYRPPILALGRRVADGNYMGRDGSGIYTKDGVVRYAPLQHWRHEDVLAAIHYLALPVPPIYTWPRGYRVGTGAWPARQWTESVAHGWRECWQIDPTVVRGAAAHPSSTFDGARRLCELVDARGVR